MLLLQSFIANLLLNVAVKKNTKNRSKFSEDVDKNLRGCFFIHTVKGGEQGRS